MAEQLLGENYRQMYSSYYGGANEKRAIAAADTFSHFKSLLGSSRFEKVIDVGAGEGSLVNEFSSNDFVDQIYAVEISESGVEAIKARHINNLIETKLFDGYKIPYEDKFFDLAVSTHVLEHVEHERLALRELQRVASHVLIEVPLENGLRVSNSIKNSGPYGHINFYTPETFINLLATTGLKPLKSRVFSSSYRYDRFVSGKTKGFIRHAVRGSALSLSRKWAPWMFTYMLTVLCEA